MAKYEVNPEAVARAEELIEARQYVVRSEWSEVQPTAQEENESWSDTRGKSTQNGISASQSGRPTRPRPGTRSSSVTSAVCTEAGSWLAASAPLSGTTRRSSW